MDIKVYGTDTSGHQLVISLMRDILVKANIPFEISEVTDVSEFLNEGIESVPAIQLDRDEIYPLKSNGSFNSSLRSAINKILTTKNYGDLPKFLIPIDFSDSSIKALSYGHRLSTDLGAITQVVHVYRPKPRVESNAKLHVLTQVDANEKLNHIVEMMDKDWGGDICQTSLVSGYFEVGFPTDKILHLAKENANDLIILGATGSDFTYKKWIGSVSSAIASKSTSPVLLIPENAKYQGIPSMMIGIDDQPLSNAMAQVISNLCTKFESKIHLVHVGKMNNDGVLATSEDVLSKFYKKDFIHSKCIDSNDVMEALTGYAKLNDIEVIAVAPRSKSLLAKIFNESISNQLREKLEKPFLILK